MGSSFGKIFQVHTFGESHGVAVGAVIAGVPAGIRLDLDRIQKQLDRRRPGQSSITSPRDEKDRLEVVSGIEDGKSLGSPICVMIRNADMQGGDYRKTENLFRPSHADFAVQKKYGISAKSGGGRASARETIGRVIAGSIAEMILLEKFPQFKSVAFVQRMHDLSCSDFNMQNLTREQVDRSIVRCPDENSSSRMIAFLKEIQASGDTVGGSIRCVIQGIPAGLGEPVFDKLEADLAKAMMSLPATKSFEIGSGLSGTFMRGSEHNDSWVKDGNEFRTTTNHSGGIQGGISNGMPIHFEVGFKPVSTIFKEQKTLNKDGEEVSYTPQGRHDPCVLPRAVPMIEAMANIVLCDHFLRQSIQENFK